MHGKLLNEATEISRSLRAKTRSLVTIKNVFAGLQREHLKWVYEPKTRIKTVIAVNGVISNITVRTDVSSTCKKTSPKPPFFLQIEAQCVTWRFKVCLGNETGSRKHSAGNVRPHLYTFTQCCNKRPCFFFFFVKITALSTACSPVTRNN